MNAQETKTAIARIINAQNLLAIGQKVEDLENIMDGIIAQIIEAEIDFDSKDGRKNVKDAMIGCVEWPLRTDGKSMSLDDCRNGGKSYKTSEQVGEVSDDQRLIAKGIYALLERLRYHAAKETSTDDLSKCIDACATLGKRIAKLDSLTDSQKTRLELARKAYQLALEQVSLELETANA